MITINLIQKNITYLWYITRSLISLWFHYINFQELTILFKTIIYKKKVFISYNVNIIMLKHKNWSGIIERIFNFLKITKESYHYVANHLTFWYNRCKRSSLIKIFFIEASLKFYWLKIFTAPCRQHPDLRDLGSLWLSGKLHQPHYSH